MTDKLIEFVEQEYGVSYRLMKSKTREQDVVTARQICIYLLRKYTTLSLKGIGLKFGGRDHSTVLHSIYTVEDRRRFDKVYREKFNKCLTFANQLTYNNVIQEEIFGNQDYAIGHA